MGKDESSRRTPVDDRKARLAEQLRANLARRKQQARARRDGSPATQANPAEQGTDHGKDA